MVPGHSLALPFVTAVALASVATFAHAERESEAVRREPSAREAGERREGETVRDRAADSPRPSRLGRRGRAPKVYLALDVGGTNFDAAAVTRDGRVIAHLADVPSPEQGSAEQITDALSTALERVRAEAKAAGYEAVGIGAGMPGQMDFERGIWLSTHKFAGATGKDLKTPIEQRLGLPVFMLNDAAAFTRGVAWKFLKDSGIEAKQVLTITLGTGLGSNYIVGGRLATPAQAERRNLRELWDFPFDGGKLEDKVSRKVIERDFAARTGRTLSPREIADLARAGDGDALAVLHAYGEALGRGLGQAQQSFKHFAPEVIVVGGGIARSLDLFGEVAADAFAKEAGYRPRFVAVTEAQPDLPVQGAAQHAILRLRRLGRAAK